MLRGRLLFAWLIGVMPLSVFPANDVVINELQYNPSDSLPYEFVELFNPTSTAIDLSGYAFTQGIAYRFPDGASLASGEYLILVPDPSAGFWRSRAEKMFGPYIGSLSNGGEELLLRAPDGRIVDNVKYSDLRPWPRGCDGYGSSMERISPDIPPEDVHSWRASTVNFGTPGTLNSVYGLPSHPALLNFRLDPAHPRSTDEVRIEAELDSPELIRRIALRYETWTTLNKSAIKTVPMTLLSQSGNHAVYQGVIPSQPSQTLVRFNFDIARTDGGTLRQPFGDEPRPFESYFVYDNDIPSQLPILWIFPNLTTSLPEKTKTIRGIAVKPLDSAAPLLFDGAAMRSSTADGSGWKVTFLKGEEYLGDRTINIAPELPTHPNTGLTNSPHVEHIGLSIFRELGVLTPRCDWYRMIEKGIHGQRIATEQPNECFLQINGRDPSSNIYKIAYNEPNSYSSPAGPVGYTKKTNLEDGVGDLYEFFDAINSSNKSTREKALRRYLSIDEAINYSVAAVLIGHWDGFFNNMFLIHNPPPFDKWEIVPWDTDKIMGLTDGYPPRDTMFVEMPLAFPLNGQSRLASRQPGPISRPLHMDQEFNEIYLQRIKTALYGLFSEASMNLRIDGMENLLLEDLKLLENYTGIIRNDRRKQITGASESMRTFVRLRGEYLRPQLPAPVEEWAMY
ncbi:MAG: CotH kinase family protein [Candidatus Omnitrophota bacterium]